MLERILALIMNSEEAGLFVIFILLLACGLGLPIPEDISIVASGMLVSTNVTNFLHAFLVCLTGIIIGDSAIYWMGRLWGRKLFKAPIISKIINNKFVSIGKIAFNRFGNKIIFFARFLPGLRAPIYFFAGSIKVSYVFFLLVDIIAASISVPIWIYLGRIFGENLPNLEKAMKHFQFGTLLLVLLLIILFIAGHYLKKRIMLFINKKENKK
ncbi:MAG: DedA family protein [bacterium]